MSDAKMAKYDFGFISRPDIQPRPVHLVVLKSNILPITPVNKIKTKRR
jgi:hypothetical protein